MNYRKIVFAALLCWMGNQAAALPQAGQTSPAVTPLPKTAPAAPAPSPSTPAAAPAAAVPAGPLKPGTAVLNKADADSWLDGYMPYALQTGDIAGAVVVVVKDGKVLTARGFGYADVEKRAPVDPERTLFRPGSVSKLVTWTAVMQLVEQGKIDLDADINKYLDFKIPPLDGQSITMRQMMTHTAGFEEAAKDVITYDTTRVPKLGELLRGWVPKRIFKAGSTPAYSNYATALAGYVVERVAGEPFETYTERHIFTPLGMKSASFRQPLPAGLLPHMATGYKTPGEASTFEVIGPGPAGSLSASGIDMGRFMLAHLQQGELDGQRIFSAATANSMHNRTLDKVDPSSLIPPLNRMELGFFETNINGRKVIAHLGDLEAFHTSLHLFMKDGVGFYVSFNSGGKDGASGTLRTALFHDFADRYLPDASTKDGVVDAATAAAHARLMQGNWENSRRSESNFFSVLGLLGQTKIVVGEKGELVVPDLVGRNGRPREWVEIAPFVWRDRNGHDRLAAKVVDGQPVRWSMDFMSPFMMFDRVPAGKSSAWIVPALCVSLGVLLLTFLAMPVGWFTRRKYRVAAPLTGTARQTNRLTQWASVAVVLVLAGWVGIFAAMYASLEYATDILDPYLWVLQCAGSLIFIASIIISGRNLMLVWRERRGKLALLWSVLVFCSTVLVAYVALRFGLVAMSVNY